MRSIIEIKENNKNIQFRKYRNHSKEKEYNCLRSCTH